MFITFYPGVSGGGGTTVSAGRYTPDVTFSNADWALTGPIVAESWFYQIVTDGGFSYVTVTGPMDAEPGEVDANGSVDVSLPLPPGLNWSYPEQLSGIVGLNQAAFLPGYNPASIITARVGALTATFQMASTLSTGVKIVCSFTYRH